MLPAVSIQIQPMAISRLDNELIAELEVLLFAKGPGSSKLRCLGGSLWQHSLCQSNPNKCMSVLYCSIRVQ